MRIISITILISLIAVAAGLTIAQIWGPWLEWDLYFKIIGTLAIVFLVIGLAVVIKADLMHKKRLKDENYID